MAEEATNETGPTQIPRYIRSPLDELAGPSHYEVEPLDRLKGSVKSLSGALILFLTQRSGMLGLMEKALQEISGKTMERSYEW